MGKLFKIHFIVRNADIGMVPFLFCESCDIVDKLHCCLKILKCEPFLQTMGMLSIHNP